MFKLVPHLFTCASAELFFLEYIMTLRITVKDKSDLKSDEDHEHLKKVFNKIVTPVCLCI